MLGAFFTMIDVFAALQHRMNTQLALLEEQTRVLLARLERQPSESANFYLPALMRSAVAPSIASLVERTFHELSRN
jgi:hypothetical protein